MQAGGGPPDRQYSSARPKAPPLFAAMAALQKSDGVLAVRAGDTQATITVMQGRVVEVVHERTSPGAVVDLLLHAGVLTPEDVARATRMSRRRDSPVDATVRAAGFVSEATLANTREFLCHEVLMDLLLRTDAKVSEPTAPRRLQREMCAMPVRFLLREAQKRATEEPAVRKVVPSDDLVYARTAALSSRGGARRWGDLPLSPAERQVFVAVNGERSVTEVAHVTGQSRYKVARALKTLLEMDLVRLARPPTPSGHPAPADARPAGSPTGRASASGTARMVRVAALALLLAALVRLGVLWLGDGRAPGPGEAWAAVVTRGANRGLTEAARVYRLIHGRPPASLDDLVREGLTRGTRGP